MGKADDVAERLRADLARGCYPPGRVLPSVRDLALRYRINPNTIVRAFAILIEEGLVVAEARRGYFAAPGSDRRARARRGEAAAEALDVAVREAIASSMSNEEIRGRVEKTLKKSARELA